jgi:hypothetical protein
MHNSSKINKYGRYLHTVTRNSWLSIQKLVRSTKNKETYKKETASFKEDGTRLTPREMENISRGPIFGDFVTILTEGSMQDNTVAGLPSTGQELRLPFPPLLNVMYCMRVSLKTVKIFHAQQQH